MIRVNMQVTGENVELNKENFPRLFYGGHQVRNISIVYTDDGIDVQHVIPDGNMLCRALNTWVNGEKIRLNKELAEIQRKLEILNSIE